MLFVIGRWQDALFGFAAIGNALIGSLQEFRAKAALDKLALLNASTARVRRDGAEAEIPPGDVVLGDVLVLRAGDQLPADAQVVGADAYANAFAGEAKRFSLVGSELRDSINRVLGWVGWAIGPVGLLVLNAQMQVLGGWRQACRTGAWVDAPTATIASVTAMIPHGLALIEIVRLVQRRYVARTLVDAPAHPTVPHPQAVSRPVPVTLAVVAVYLGGLASAMFGVLFLLSRYEVPADLVVIVSLVGAGIILFGLLSVAAAAGLSRGSGLSRLFVTLLAAALIVLQAWTLALAREWSWWAAAQIVVYLLVLIALWAPPPGAARRVRVAPGEGCTPGEGGAGARAVRQSVQARPARRLVIRSISADWVARIDSATCSVRGSLPRSRRASAIGTAPSWWRIISRRNVQSAAVPDSARSWARSAALAIPIWVMSSASDAGADPPPCS